MLWLPNERDFFGRLFIMPIDGVEARIQGAVRKPRKAVEWILWARIVYFGEWSDPGQCMAAYLSPEFGGVG
jgi:hypothetical protein